MDLSYSPLTIESQALEMEYFLVPWDTEILCHPVGQISKLKVKEPAEAGSDFDAFQTWLKQERIKLCSCRLSHDSLTEAAFLQAQGFRFIELNYRPCLQNLQELHFPTDSIEILRASPADEDELAWMAGKIFRHGRFHQDPYLGAEPGNRRYEAWLRNSFRIKTQVTYKCMLDGKTVGFFVVEFPEDNLCFWSLIGLAPGLGGQGLGTRVWNAMAKLHQQEGIERIETSISSHNTAVFNLYIKLGYLFPMPWVTFHWTR